MRWKNCDGCGKLVDLIHPQFFTQDGRMYCDSCKVDRPEYKEQQELLAKYLGRRYP